MGSKRSAIYQIARYLMSRRQGLHNSTAGRPCVSRPRTGRGLLGRLALTLVVFGLIFSVSAIALMGYTIDKVRTAVQFKSLDLWALEQLIRDKVIVLTEQQKTALAPLVQDLNKAGLDSQAVENLKSRMWKVLDPAQVKKIEEWQSQARNKAQDLLSSGRSALWESASKYTGIPGQGLRNALRALSPDP